MSHESVFYMKTKMTSFETQQRGKSYKNNVLVPESDEKPPTEQQYSLALTSTFCCSVLVAY